LKERFVLEQNVEAQYMNSDGTMYEGLETVEHIDYGMMPVVEMTVGQTW
jgi:hypothetical protein